MITFDTGVVRAISAGTTPTLTVETADGRRCFAEVPLPIGDVSDTDVVCFVATSLDVGLRHVDLTVALGAWPCDAPNPAGPLGLASAPVIVLPDATWTDLATSGALRAGRHAACLRLPHDRSSLGLRMLDAVTEGIDVLLIEGGSGAHLRVARALGGRPIAALPLSDPAAISSMLRGCDVDVLLPVPALEEPARTRLQATLGPMALEAIHQLVEVDPAPAFAHSRLALTGASLEAMGAGAAGVLGGRLVDGNRRWRAQLDT
ncbi:MAG: hypothetical protein ABJB55_02545 [Actinomycetota bacterium]